MNRASAILEESMPYPRRSRRCEDCTQASAMPKLRKRKGGCLTHRKHQLLTTIRCLSTVIFNVNLHAHMVARSVTLTSPGQPGLSFARTCMASQCITSWGLSSNGIASLFRPAGIRRARGETRPYVPGGKTRNVVYREVL